MSMMGILRMVASHHGLGERDLIGVDRRCHVTRARHIAMWLIRDRRQRSYAEIARVFERTHTTILDGCRKVDGDPRLRELAEQIGEEIDGD